MRYMQWSMIGLSLTGIVAGSADARAEMVVIATTAPKIEIGSVIEYGTDVSLPPGASVTVLAADGSSRTLASPGGLLDSTADATVDGSRVMEALSGLVIQKENGSRLGAIRSVDAANCPKSGTQEDITALTEAGCMQAATAALSELTSTLAPSLYVGTTRGDSTFSFGDEITLEIQSNFEAFVYCFHEGSDGMTTRLLPLSGKPTPHVDANRPAHMPGSLGSAQIEAGTPAGLDTIQCYATDRDIAAEMPLIFDGPPMVGVEALGGPIATMFDKIWIERLAVASVELEVNP